MRFVEIATESGQGGDGIKRSNRRSLQELLLAGIATQWLRWGIGRSLDIATLLRVILPLLLRCAPVWRLRSHLLLGIAPGLLLGISVIHRERIKSKESELDW